LLYISNMKRTLINTVVVSLTILLVSWGYKGHRVTALIAEDYLTPQAKQAVKAILGSETLADVSTWADDVKKDPQYGQTASWHYLNLPLGLSYQDFVEVVGSQSNENISSAIQRAENTLSRTEASTSDKGEALKFLVHFIGDAHQPMHVSRAEDKGGNTIQVRFDGIGTNLHALWDSKLIDHEGLSETELKQKIESDIKPGDIKSYQASRPTKWLYESYTTATMLYQDIAKDNKVTEAQYRQYIQLVHERLAAGGLRLAGVLNDIFKNQTVVPGIQPESKVSDAKGLQAKSIDAKDAANHIREFVSIQAVAYSSKDFGSFVLVNLGAAYPNQPVTIMLRGEAKKLSNGIDGKKIIVRGKLIDYKGKPEIIVTDVKQISVNGRLGETIDTDRQGG